MLIAAFATKMRSWSEVALSNSKTALVGRSLILRMDYFTAIFYFALSSMKLFSGKPPKSRSSMYICGLIPRNYAKLAEAVPIVVLSDITRERVLWFL